MFRRAAGKTLGFVGFAIQYGCVAHCAFEYIGELVACSGPSMEPTITSRDVVFSERLSRHFYRIEKGDIVIAKSPFDPKMNVCKRVIGLEGDKVCTSGPSDVFKTHTYRPVQRIPANLAGRSGKASLSLSLSPRSTEDQIAGLPCSAGSRGTDSPHSR
ncbi:mitochondrial inner membrane protease subunit 1 isoform X2 [Anguilla anguilla]|uniref:mitochondrial inner membrane protease subunit 1 isoform X2 n=1 Tax=Anguilla anguilla TaxID=7936 RepID=UPI0015AC42EC|nr:mitochondrial inner membrane protease subunit 1 isoform X2 [Anguilla anguilla]